MLDASAILNTKDPANIRFGIRTDNPKSHASLLQFSEHRVYTCEEFDLRVVTRGRVSHPIHEERQFPFGKPQILHHLFAGVTAQLLKISFLNTAQLECIRHAVEFVQEPQGRVRQGAVKIEKSEFESHQRGATLPGSLSSSNSNIERFGVLP